MILKQNIYFCITLTSCRHCFLLFFTPCLHWIHPTLFLERVHTTIQVFLVNAGHFQKLLMAGGHWVSVLLVSSMHFYAHNFISNHQLSLKMKDFQSIVSVYLSIDRSILASIRIEFKFKNWFFKCILNSALNGAQPFFSCCPIMTEVEIEWFWYIAHIQCRHGFIGYITVWMWLKTKYISSMMLNFRFFNMSCWCFMNLK